MPLRTVLITGAAGNIGKDFARRAAKRYALTLMVHESNSPSQRRAIARYGKVVEGDVANIKRLTALFAGSDTIVHLAGDPSPNAEWDSLLQTNIVGTYNVFLAAKAARCRRVIYASSIHAVSGYPPDVQVHADDPVNPGDLYGVSKCFGEALARYMAEQEGLSCIAIRIGGFQPPTKVCQPAGVSMLDAWISQRDMAQLLCKSIDVEHLPFAILHGLSDNRFKRMDITQARKLVGYQPQDDLTEANPKLKPLKLKTTVLSHNVGDPAEHSAVENHLRSLGKRR